MKFNLGLFIKLILIGFILFIIYRLRIADELIQESIDNSHFTYNQKFDKEDSTLFNSIALGIMKSRFILESNYRNPLKAFDYDSLGILYYTKINLENDLPMDQVIMFQEKSSTTPTMHQYYELDGNRNEFSVLCEKTPNKIDKIIFSLNEKWKLEQRNVYNANFISYYLPVSSFSVRYCEEAPIDIFFGGFESINNTRVAYPLMFSFYKIQKSLYVFILIPQRAFINIESDLFEKIINFTK